jgi:hypothetical protein
MMLTNTKSHHANSFETWIRRAAISFVSGVAILGSVSCGKKPAAAVAQPTVKQNLFPFSQGSTWTYDSSVGLQNLTLVATVTGANVSGDQTIVTLRWTTNGNPSQEEMLYVTKDQVSRERSGPQGQLMLTPPLPMIKYPLEVGKSWTWSGTSAVSGRLIPQEPMIVRVVSIDKVHTAIGTFDAYRVEVASERVGGSTLPTITNWYAEGVGLVKQRAKIPNLGLITATLSKYVVR